MTETVVKIYYLTMCELGVQIQEITEENRVVYTVPKFSEIMCTEEYRLPNQISIGASSYPIQIPLQGSFLLAIVANMIREMDGVPLGEVRDETWTEEKRQEIRNKMIVNEDSNESSDSVQES